MIQKFRTKELVVCGLFGAMIFVVCFILGSAIIMITGIPATGGIINMLIAVTLTVIGIKIVDKFGIASAMLTITGIMSVPTLTFGSPGIYKIILMFLVGLMIDIIILASKRKNWGYIIGGALAAFLAPLFIYLTLTLLGLSGAEKLKPLLIPLMLFYAVLGLIGAYLGLWIYDKKLKNKAFIKQVQA